MITGAILLGMILLISLAIGAYLLYREHQRASKQSFITRNIHRFAWWCGNYDMKIFGAKEPDIIFVRPCVSTPPPSPIEYAPPDTNYPPMARSFPEYGC